jgi:hypothetical protein
MLGNKTQQPRQSQNDHLQDNMGVLHTPYDSFSTIVPLHPTCNSIKWEMTHVNIQEFITWHLHRKEPN